MSTVYEKRVKEVMSRDLVTIDAKDSVHEALQLMAENKVAALPVVDRQGRSEEARGFLEWALEIRRKTSRPDDPPQRRESPASLGRQGRRFAVDRHFEHVGAEKDQQVVLFEHPPDIRLIPRQAPQIRFVFREKMRAIRHGLLIDRCPEQIGEPRGLRQRVRGDDLVAGDDRGTLGGEEPHRQAVERFVAGARGRVDPGARQQVGCAVQSPGTRTKALIELDRPSLDEVVDHRM